MGKYGSVALMFRMLIEEIQYEYANRELTVKLKPVFEALRLIKLYGNHENASEKVRTLKKPLNREVLEYLNEQIALMVNSKVRTLKTRIVPNKKAPEGANLLNGAPDGMISEPNERDIFSILEDEECQILFRKIEKLLAA